jgi:hypothetical protein
LFWQSWFLTDVIASIPIDFILRASMGILLCSMADTCHRDHAHYLGEVTLLRMLRVRPPFMQGARPIIQNPEMQGFAVGETLFIQGGVAATRGGVRNWAVVG